VAQAPGEQEWSQQLEWTATLLRDIEAELYEGRLGNTGAEEDEVSILHKVALVRKRLLKLQNDLSLLWQSQLKRTHGVSPSEQNLRALMQRFAALRSSDVYKETLQASVRARQSGEKNQHASARRQTAGDAVSRQSQKNRLPPANGRATGAAITTGTMGGDESIATGTMGGMQASYRSQQGMSLYQDSQYARPSTAPQPDLGHTEAVSLGECVWWWW
jgi:hypothetical protein